MLFTIDRLCRGWPLVTKFFPMVTRNCYLGPSTFSRSSDKGTQ